MGETGFGCTAGEPRRSIAALGGFIVRASKPGGKCFAVITSNSESVFEGVLPAGVHAVAAPHVDAASPLKGFVAVHSDASPKLVPPILAAMVQSADYSGAGMGRMHGCHWTLARGLIAEEMR